MRPTAIDRSPPRRNGIRQRADPGDRRLVAQGRSHMRTMRSPLARWRAKRLKASPSATLSYRGAAAAVRGYAKPYRFQILCALVCSTFGGAVTAMEPLVVALLIQAAIDDASRSMLLTYLAGFALLGYASAGLTRIRDLVAASA